MPSLKLSNPFRRGADRPTLKQRAAALKASAARVMRRPKPTGPAPSPAIDWHNAPEGFMAHPAIEPQCFLNIKEGIRREADRLLTIAVKEYEHRADALGPSATDAERAAWARKLRGEYHLDALASIAHPDMIEPFVGVRYKPETAEVAGTASAGDSAPTAGDDLLELGRRFDAAHAAWLVACEANREPSERHSAYLREAKLRGGPTMEDIHAAEALPGVREPWLAEDRAFGIVGDLGLEILRQPARTVAELALQARAVIPHVWPSGQYEEAADPDEDVDDEVVRLLIESACAAAGVDWRGNPVEQPEAIMAADPIHAAIAASRKAEAALEAWGVEERRPTWAAEESELVAEQTRAREAVLATVPTTRAGQLALLDFVRWQLELHGHLDGSPPDADCAIWQETHQALVACVKAGVPPYPPAQRTAAPALSALSVHELWHLAETYREGFMWWGRVANAPWARSDNRENCSPAGDAAEAEYERHMDQWSAVHAEAQRRQPSTDTERDELLSLRLSHEMECEGRICDRDLLADISKMWGA